MKVLSFINQKGGVGKTTSCVNVGAALAQQGHKVLLIDLDAQANLTTGLGIPVGDDTLTMYEVLKEKCNINQAVAKHGKLQVLPSDIRLSSLDIELCGVVGRDTILKDVIALLYEPFDYVLLDCSPSLGIIPLMALTASDGVVIPVQSQFFALSGLAQLLDTISMVRRRMNPNLSILGIVLTMYDNRRILDKEVYKSVQDAFPDTLFSTTISNNIALAEAPGQCKDIFAHDPDCKGALQYASLAKEILERL